MQEPSTSSESEPPKDIEGVISRYSTHLALFRFEKAIEFSESTKKTSLNDTWPLLFNVLSQFASAESHYFSLSFFSSKFSFRREKIHLRDTYGLIDVELKKLFDDWDLEPKAANMDYVLVFLRQFMAVVETRIKLIEFYSFLSASNWKTFTEEALKRLAEIDEALKLVFKNVIRFQQFSNLCTEVSILQKLFKTQQELLEIPVIDTVLQIKDLQENLNQWLDCVNIQEDPNQPRPFFSFAFTNKGRPASKFALLYWLHSFQNFLMAKINLYYYTTLTNYLPTGDFRSIITNSQPSFLQHFHAFMRRSNAQLTALIMNRMDLADPFFDFSYHKFLKKYSPDYCKPITGVKGHFPALVYFPQEKIFEKYHPSITSLIQESCLRGEQNDRIKYLHDDKALETFFITHVEKRVYLVVVFDRKIAEKDPVVQSFFNEILLCLKGSQLTHQLKFGFK
ncbi:hypothetical protein M3Y97_00226700 [Aphelenchoides bicaudatus]|nr:hypothetical protein M3Y97_00226700 [Aphelenchoides bicaudatus]